MQYLLQLESNGLSVDEWLRYGSQESLSYFMYQKPRSAKRLYFDVIPRAVDEYHQQLRAYPGQDLAQQLANPAFHIHGTEVPASDMVVPFAMLLNLASVSAAEDKEALWGFLRRYAPEASPQTHPGLDAAAERAVRYFNDVEKPQRHFREPTEQERAVLRRRELVQPARGLRRREVGRLLDRDRQDMERPVAPLKKAEDAVELDTTGLTFGTGPYSHTLLVVNSAFIHVLHDPPTLGDANPAVIAVTAVRTGVGKSQTSRYVAGILQRLGTFGIGDAGELRSRRFGKELALRLWREEAPSMRAEAESPPPPLLRWLEERLAS